MRYLLLCLLACSFISCNKEKTEDVFIRIVNNTSQSMENITVGTNTLGTVAPGGSSEFVKMDSPVYAPYCQFTWSGSRQMSGMLICGTPMPSAIEGGYYTYTITEAGLGFRLDVSR